jgi:hypothetical protein
MNESIPVKFHATELRRLLKAQRQGGLRAIPREHRPLRQDPDLTQTPLPGAENGSKSRDDHSHTNTGPPRDPIFLGNLHSNANKHSKTEGIKKGDHSFTAFPDRLGVE